MEENSNDIEKLKAMIKENFEEQRKLIARLETALEAVTSFNGIPGIQAGGGRTGRLEPDGQRRKAGGPGRRLPQQGDETVLPFKRSGYQRDVLPSGRPGALF